MISVSVIIVNYNTAQEVQACVSSVLAQQAITFEVWVVDNASQDDSVKQLNDRFGARLHLLAEKSNWGFGQANNLAAAQAQGEYLYFLNPDAQLPDPLSLKRLVDFIKQDPHCGLIGSTVIDSHSRQIIQPAYRYPGQRHLQHTQLGHLPGDLAWLQGSSMLMPRVLFQRLHGFDPDYFLYAEETDLCLRVRQAGYRLALCSEVVVEHIGGASQRLEKVYATRLKKQQGLYLFYHKHYHPKDAQGLAQRALRRSLYKIVVFSLLRFLSAKHHTTYWRQRAIYQAAKEYLGTRGRNHPAT